MKFEVYAFKRKGVLDNISIRRNNMEKKISPFILIGVCLVTIGTLLNVLLPRYAADWEHNWISIPILVLAIILLITGIYKTVKEKSKNE
jgi:H+/Cl- antiporter ClcA